MLKGYTRGLQFELEVKARLHFMKILKYHELLLDLLEQTVCQRLLWYVCFIRVHLNKMPKPDPTLGSSL